MPRLSRVTGTSVALRGELLKGSLRVKEFCTSGLAPQPPLPHRDTDTFILLASDLQLGRDGVNPLPSQLLADYVCGHLGSSAEQEFCASIVRVVLAGNTAPSAPPDAMKSYLRPYIFSLSSHSLSLWGGAQFCVGTLSCC